MGTILAMTNAVGALPEAGSAQSIGWLVVTLAALALAIERGAKFMDRFREQPSPPDTYVTIKECRTIHSGAEQRIQRLECDVGAIRTEVQTMGNRLDLNDETRAKALHDRINHVEALVNQILGSLKKHL